MTSASRLLPRWRNQHPFVRSHVVLNLSMVAKEGPVGPGISLWNLRCRAYLVWLHMIMFPNDVITRAIPGDRDHRSLPDAGLIIRGRYQHQPSPMKDPSLAIDQLCAELELNTEQPMTAADKRRSFPTSYARDSAFATGSSVYEQPMRRLSEKRAPPIERKAQPYQQPPVGLYHAAAVSSHQPVHQSHSTPMNNQHRVTHAAAQHPPQQPQPAAQVQRVPQPPQFATQPVVKKSNPQRQQKSLDEVTNMLNNVVNDFHATQQPPRKKSQPSHALYATPHSMNQSNPFETINQEKINPSRVEAMHNMFERNAAPAQNRWSAQPPYQPHLIRPREDDAYHDINDYHSNRPHVMKAATATIPPPPSTAAPVPPPYIGPHASPPRHNAIGIRNSSPSYVTEFTPAYPTTQPPSHPPGRNGSATSSQNGGYYSSNSSGVGAPSYQHSQISARRGSIVGHQSASSRAASIADDDDDDGFYDNIGTYDDRRISRSSEMDIQSLSSHQLPPNNWKPTKIGSFFRKIGAGNRPPGSAASLVSLNKVANETPMKPGNLMKSNSLSTEPWKKMVIENPSIPARERTANKYQHDGMPLKIVAQFAAILALRRVPGVRPFVTMAQMLLVCLVVLIQCGGKKKPEGGAAAGGAAPAAGGEKKEGEGDKKEE
ncbi:unnamed protein product [Haemonchus placei]|uniref:Chitin synthase n=1 Tax=Haemonchus placei TaxID=6290 RepID=A0A0N4WDI7_HAEPC|nr:unnamed protein product [Haemonchus placei]